MDEHEVLLKDTIESTGLYTALLRVGGVILDDVGPSEVGKLLR
jgi:hypothetical protein